ncbi:MAG: hypothetical protein JXB00_04075 [Bacteroidales bacterium]|nr:hypothetical protein [Bacteroidales bacterium]
MNDHTTAGIWQKIHMKFIKFRIYRIVMALFTVFFLLYMVFSLMAPYKSLKSFEEMFKPDEKEHFDLALVDTRTDSIIKSGAAIKSKLLLAAFDSISLCISLPDSTISLQMQGVTIHTARISRYKTSRLFGKAGRPQLYKYLSTPFISDNYRSSIVKVPIVVKHAPKDTTEANNQKSVPELPREKYVRVSYRFDKPLFLLIEQEEKPAGMQRFKSFALRTGDRIRYFAKTASDIFTFKTPGYTPWIKISIQGDEAKTIFRALPEKAALALEI